MITPHVHTKQTFSMQFQAYFTREMLGWIRISNDLTFLKKLLRNPAKGVKKFFKPYFDIIHAGTRFGVISSSVR